jgi:hypothetical protein
MAEGAIPAVGTTGTTASLQVLTALQNTRAKPLLDLQKHFILSVVQSLHVRVGWVWMEW